MKNKSVVIEDGINFPTWALSYMVNADMEGLTAEEISQIDTWCKEYPEGTIFATKDEIECYFSKNPAFGLPCECCEMNAILVKPEFVPYNYIGNSAWGFVGNTKHLMEVARAYGWQGVEPHEDTDDFFEISDELSDYLSQWLPEDHSFVWRDGELWVVPDTDTDFDQ